MNEVWQVFALKYADRNERTRAESFLDDDDHASPHAMDYFVWVLRSVHQTIVVDTGYDFAEAKRRKRPIIRDPAKALEALTIDAETVETVIITHLHYDHAGGLDRYPKATFHLQESEMAFATGPCMCGDLKAPFTADHVCEMVRHVYSGRVVFHNGDAQVAPGVSVHCVGGHSRGLQVVRVKTRHGWMCLASDAAHYYENYERKKLFPIVADKDAMIAGFDTIQKLASRPELIIPGHDPLVQNRFEVEGHSGFIWRLDRPKALS